MIVVKKRGKRKHRNRNLLKITLFYDPLRLSVQVGSTSVLKGKFYRQISNYE